MARVGQVKASGNDPSAARLTDLISLGVLAEVFPRDVIEDVLTRRAARAAVAVAPGACDGAFLPGNVPVLR